MHLNLCWKFEFPMEIENYEATILAPHANIKISLKGKGVMSANPVWGGKNTWLSQGRSALGIKITILETHSAN